MFDTELLDKILRKQDPLQLQELLFVEMASSFFAEKYVEDEVWLHFLLKPRPRQGNEIIRYILLLKLRYLPLFLFDFLR